MNGLPIFPPTSDYNYLVKHVNANHSGAFAVNYYPMRVFSEQRKAVA